MHFMHGNLFIRCNKTSTKDNIPALNPKKCFCGKTYPWVENDGMTRTLNTCEDCRKTQQIQKKHTHSSRWKRKRCLSCNNHVGSIYSRFCSKCDPRIDLTPKMDDSKKKAPDIKKSTMVPKISLSSVQNNHIIYTENSKKLISDNKQTNVKCDSIVSIQNLNYTKLENPGLNFCFMNSAIQYMISIEPLSDLICYGYCKLFAKIIVFLVKTKKLKY